MKIIRSGFIVIALFISITTIAQQTAVKNIVALNQNKKALDKQTGKLSTGIGIAGYFEDLVENNKLFYQPGIAFATGVSYGDTYYSTQFKIAFNL